MSVIVKKTGQFRHYFKTWHLQTSRFGLRGMLSSHDQVDPDPAGVRIVWVLEESSWEFDLYVYLRNRVDITRLPARSW